MVRWRELVGVALVHDVVGMIREREGRRMRDERLFCSVMKLGGLCGWRGLMLG